MIDAFIRACAAVLAVRLPPDADLLLVERQRVARCLLAACEQYGLVRAAFDVVDDPASRQRLSALEAQAVDAVHANGERLLQLQASVTGPESRALQ